MSEQRVAGRELDVEVYAAVFGACVEWTETADERRAAVWSVTTPDRGKFWWAKNSPASGASGYLSVDLPHYSTDIAAAWLVVDELRAIGFMRVDVVRDEYAICRVWRSGTNLAAELSAPTAPLAVCLAALAAMPDKPTGTADAVGPVPHEHTLTNSSLVSRHREDEPR